MAAITRQVAANARPAATAAAAGVAPSARARTAAAPATNKAPATRATTPTRAIRTMAVAVTGRLQVLDKEGCRTRSPPRVAVGSPSTVYGTDPDKASIGNRS